MTKELCIVETLVLPETVNTPLMAQTLEIKDDKKCQFGQTIFGAVGYKYEDNKLDGSALQAGIVGIPTAQALIMMLQQVGFSEISVYKDWRQLKKEVYFGQLPRSIHAIIVVAKKNPHPRGLPTTVPKDTYLLDLQNKEIVIVVPEDLIVPCYEFVTGRRLLADLPPRPRCICESQVNFFSNEDDLIQKEFMREFFGKPYYFILEAFKYAPYEKIAFELAKARFYGGYLSEALEITNSLVKTVNLDWRTTYRSYHLLSLIYERLKDMAKAREYNRRCLMTFTYFEPAIEWRKLVNCN